MKNISHSYRASHLLHILLIPAGLFVGASYTHACSVCGCSLSSDWAAQGYQSTSGFQAGVRYEYSDQTQLRTGSHSASRANYPFPNADEVQQSTSNHAVWLGLDYSSPQAWGVSVELPYFDRDHSTVVDGDTAVSTSHASGVGDLRVLGRYQFVSTHTQNFSVQIGVKLPTGRFDQNFATGPQAGGLLDRGLQLGTGTTDVLAGVSYFSRLGDRVGAFASALLDQPVAERADFRPSTTLGLNAGVRLLTTGWLTPQLQVNTRIDGHESGGEGDYDNSGGTFVYLSPGATAELGERVNAYVFLQVPVYQHVNGLQLEPKWLLSTGISFKL
jgi:hypothetical protein